MRSVARAPVLLLAVAVAVAVVAGGCAAATPSSPPSTDAPASSASMPGTANPSPATATPPIAPASFDPAELVVIPGTHVSMVPPDGYALADAFPGFLADDGSSIVVTEIPGTLAQLVEGLDEAGFATQGIELIDAAAQPFGLHDGWLYEGIQRVGDLEAVKWMAVVGNDRGAVLVTASVISGDGLDARAAVLTTTYDQDRVFDPLEGLAYAVDAAAPLRYAGRVANSLTYNTSGTTPSADPLEPLLSVGPSLGGAPIDDRTGFAHARLAQIPLMDDADIEAEAAVEIDGLEGIEILATAVHASGEPIALLQTTLFPDAGYVLIVGRCRVRDAQQFVPLFREMAASFRRSAP